MLFSFSRGVGVIGEQPVILPKTGFEYSSACPLTTANGRMVRMIYSSDSCYLVTCTYDFFFLVYNYIKFSDSGEELQ